jgi:hypothetical protein
MHDSTDARAPWTSRPSSARADARLIASVVSREALAESDRAAMCALMDAYYEGVTPDRFRDDLAEKGAVIVLRERETGDIAGFSTVMTLSAMADGEPVTGVFSGDTIVARGHWGEGLLARVWIDAVLAEVRAVQRLRPGAPVYWFLICAGYKTFRYLPLFFRRFVPQPGAAAGAREASQAARLGRIAAAFARAKFGDAFDEAAGVVRLRHATPLRSGIADVTAARLRDPAVAFFARANPGHVHGDELVCLAEVSLDNLTPAGLRMVGARPA